MAENFDRLVSEISSDERKSMLDKMGKPQNDVPVESAPPKKPIEPIMPIHERLKKESILLRLFLWIKSLFSGTSTIELYKSLRVDRILRVTEAKYRDLINGRTESLLTGFYERLSQVKNASDFFSTYLLPIEQDTSSYLVFLGSIVIPTVNEDIESRCNPYTMSLENNGTSELRASFFRRMDDIFDSMDPIKKQQMYSAVKTADWFREFSKIPLNSILNKFSQGENGNYTCKYGSLESDIRTLATVFCNTPNFSEGVLQSFFRFKEEKTTLNSYDDSNEDTLEKYFDKAESQVSMIKMFASSVPLVNLGKIVSDDADWQCPNFGGGEDWFVRYKAQWKNILEKKWEAWNRDCQKEAMRKSFESYYKVEKLPLLPNRPWAPFTKEIQFRYELTGGFLYWFFCGKFKKIDEIFKIVIIEGDFAIKENRAAFMNAYNEILSAISIMETMVMKISPNGEFEVILKNLSLSNELSAAGKSKLSSTISMIETDIDSAIKKFGNSCRTLSPILKGFFSAAKDKVYGPLNNLMMIRGIENEKFRMDLEDAKKQLELAYDFIVKMEPLDVPLAIKAT